MNRNNPLVSVVIPTYNHSHFLMDAVQSALAQGYDPYEVIIVDDGSTDDTAAVLEEVKSRIRYVYQHNQGLAGARNTGILAAKGEYIALLDSDDLWEPNFLSEMIELTQKRPDATVYYCGIKYIDQNMQALPQTGGIKVIDERNFYRTILRSNFLIPSTIVMKRAAIVEAGGFDVSFRRLQDWELWVRLLRAGHTFAGLNAHLVRYRVHGENLSTDPVGGQQAARALFEKNFGADDGHWAQWDEEKRTAFAGYYRYGAISAVQRQKDWQSAADYLRKALECDPSLAEDTNLFFDLALGSQPAGYRGSSTKLTLDENASQIEKLLGRAFEAAPGDTIQGLRGKAYSTAYLALGLAAYNTNERRSSRRWLSKAIRHYPRLLRNPRVGGMLLRTFLSPGLVNRLKKYRQMISGHKAVNR